MKVKHLDAISNFIATDRTNPSPAPLCMKISPRSGLCFQMIYSIHLDVPIERNVRQSLRYSLVPRRSPILFGRLAQLAGPRAVREGNLYKIKSIARREGNTATDNLRLADGVL